MLFQRKPRQAPPGDNLGSYVSQTDQPSLEARRYFALARLLGICLAASVIVIIVLTSLIHAMLPLYRVDPFIIGTVRRSDQLIDIQRVDLRQPGSQNVAEIMARKYVLLRETIVADPQEQRKRWADGADLWSMTEEDEFKRFRIAAAPELQRILDNSMTRDTCVITSSRLDDDYWQVEYLAIDKQLNKEISRQVWQATLRGISSDKRIQLSRRLQNPIGFTVLSYSTQRKLGSTIQECPPDEG